MTDPMLEQQLSASTDTLSGIRIEESLNSQFNYLDHRITDRKVKRFNFSVWKFWLQKWDRGWDWGCCWSAGAGYCRPEHDHQRELRGRVRPHLQPLHLLHPQHQGRHGGARGEASHHHLWPTQKCFGEFWVGHFVILAILLYLACLIHNCNM